MNHTYFQACSDYLSSTGISFDWFDFGSSGSQDAYLSPLYLNPGKYLFVDGRDTDIPTSIVKLRSRGYRCTEQIVPLNSFISNQDGWLYLYETSEGSGSTFYPSRDLDTAPLKPTELSAFQRKPVKAISISSFLKKNNINPFFGKIDLEGSEEQVLNDLFSNNLAPLILEIEINVGSLSENKQGMETHSLLSSHGYRLIDLRKTYDFPLISEQSLISQYLMNDQPTSVAYQGFLHQFDGLYVHTSLFDSLSPDSILKAIYCLAHYRQFHLSIRLVESAISDIDLRELCLNFLEGCYSEFAATMNNDSSSYHGFHPWFNWVKAH